MEAAIERIERSLSILIQKQEESEKRYASDEHHTWGVFFAII